MCVCVGRSGDRGVGVFQVAFGAESMATISDNHPKEREREREGVPENMGAFPLCQVPFGASLQPKVGTPIPVTLSRLVYF